MEHIQLFQRLKVFDYCIAKHCNDKVAQKKYFVDAETLLEEIDSNNCHNELVYHLDFHECTKFSEFLYDFYCYQEEVLNNLEASNNGVNVIDDDDDRDRGDGYGGTGNDGSDSANIKTILIDVKNETSNINTDSYDCIDVIRAQGITNPEEDSREIPILRHENDETLMDMPTLPTFSEKNSIEINDNYDSILRQIDYTPHFPELSNIRSLTDNCLQEEQENSEINELSEAQERLRNLQLGLIQNSFNNTQNERPAQIYYNILNNSRRLRSTPRISSAQQTNIRRSQIIIPNPSPRPERLFIMEFRNTDIYWTYQDDVIVDNFIKRYISSLKEKEYLKILIDLSDIEIDFIIEIPVFSNDLPFEHETNTEINLAPMCEDNLLTDLPPICVPALLQSYNSNLRNLLSDPVSLPNLDTNTHIDDETLNKTIPEHHCENVSTENPISLPNLDTNTHIDDETLNKTIPEHHCENVSTENIEEISTKVFYGSCLSPIREHARIPSDSRTMNENLIVSIQNLPRISSQELNRIYNPNLNTNEITDMPSEPIPIQNIENIISSPSMRWNQCTGILRQRKEINNYKETGRICPQLRRKKKRRKKNEPNPSNLQQMNTENIFNNDDYDNTDNIQAFKRVQEEFMKLYSPKYQGFFKFDNAYYIDIYDSKQYMSYLNILELLISSNNKPIPKNMIFPNDITDKEINWRRNVIKNLTELQITEMLNCSDVETDDEENFAAIQLKKSTFSNNVLN